MDYRKIIHVDMDAFFASIEQRDHPEFKGKPIAVGHDGPRGVVAAASYEARCYGVRSAMAIVTAKRYCPGLIVVDSDYHYYKEVSKNVHRIFTDYTDKIEPLSIDEAFLDVTDNADGIGSAIDIAHKIRRRIREELHLTASAGISYNKFLAKIASDYRKPDGQFSVSPEEAVDFLAMLSIDKFWGVGSKTCECMHKMGVFTGYDLKAVSQKHLIEVFGKMGTVYYNFARGIDDRPVEPISERKSVGCEQTMEKDITMPSQMRIVLYHLVIELVDRIKKAHFDGRTLTLKIKYSNFKTTTRSESYDHSLQAKEEILHEAKRLLQKVDYSIIKPVRLIGLSVCKLEGEDKSERNPNWIQGWLDFEEDIQH